GLGPEDHRVVPHARHAPGRVATTAGPLTGRPRTAEGATPEPSYPGNSWIVDEIVNKNVDSSGVAPSVWRTPLEMKNKDVRPRPTRPRQQTGPTGRRTVLAGRALRRPRHVHLRLRPAAPAGDEDLRHHPRPGRRPRQLRHLRHAGRRAHRGDGRGPHRPQV